MYLQLHYTLHIIIYFCKHEIAKEITKQRNERSMVKGRLIHRYRQNITTYNKCIYNIRRPCIHFQTHIMHQRMCCLSQYKLNGVRTMTMSRYNSNCQWVRHTQHNTTHHNTIHQLSVVSVIFVCEATKLLVCHPVYVIITYK